MKDILDRKIVGFRTAENGISHAIFEGDWVEELHTHNSTTGEQTLLQRVFCRVGYDSEIPALKEQVAALFRKKWDESLLATPFTCEPVVVVYGGEEFESRLAAASSILNQKGK